MSAADDAMRRFKRGDLGPLLELLGPEYQIKRVRPPTLRTRMLVKAQIRFEQLRAHGIDKEEAIATLAREFPISEETARDVANYKREPVRRFRLENPDGS